VSAWPEVFDELVSARYPRLLAYGRFLAPAHEAADLVQEGLASTFIARARFESPAQAEAYVRRAMASRSIDTSRRRVRDQRALAKVWLERPVVADGPGSGLGAAVETAVVGLPPRTRACIVLRHLEDLSVRQTAEVLGLSEGAVKRYTADGLAALAVVLSAQAPRETAPVRLTTREVPDARPR